MARFVGPAPPPPPRRCGVSVRGITSPPRLPAMLATAVVPRLSVPRPPTPRPIVSCVNSGGSRIYRPRYTPTPGWRPKAPSPQRWRPAHATPAYKPPATARTARPTGLFPRVRPTPARFYSPPRDPRLAQGVKNVPDLQRGSLAIGVPVRTVMGTPVSTPAAVAPRVSQPYVQKHIRDYIEKTQTQTQLSPSQQPSQQLKDKEVPHSPFGDPFADFLGDPWDSPMSKSPVSKEPPTPPPSPTIAADQPSTSYLPVRTDERTDEQGRWTGESWQTELTRLVDMFAADPIGSDLPTPLSLTCMLAHCLPNSSPHDENTDHHMSECDHDLSILDTHVAALPSQSHLVPLPPLTLRSGRRSGTRCLPSSRLLALSEHSLAAPLVQYDSPALEQSPELIFNHALTRGNSCQLLPDLPVEVENTVGTESPVILFDDDDDDMHTDVHEASSITSPVASHAASHDYVSFNIKSPVAEMHNEVHDMSDHACEATTSLCHSDVEHVWQPDVTLVHNYLDCDSLATTQIIDDYCSENSPKHFSLSDLVPKRDLPYTTSPYGVPQHIIDELRSRNIGYCFLPCDTTGLSNREKLSPQIQEPKKKQTDIYSTLFVKPKTEVNTCVYRITTRSLAQQANHDPQPSNPQDTPDVTMHDATPNPSSTTSSDDIPPNDDGEPPHPPNIDIPSVQPSPEPNQPSTQIPEIIAISQSPTNIPQNADLRQLFPMTTLTPASDISPLHNLSKIVQRPKSFSGTGPNFNRQYTKVWLEQLQCWLECIQQPEHDHVTIAMTYLQPPAFNIMVANKKRLQNENKWHNTLEQFASLLLQNYGDIDAEHTLTTKLLRLRLKNFREILTYTKQFHDLCTRITNQPLSEQAKVSTFLNGILDKRLLQELIIEPLTGKKWTNFSNLYDYVMSKYSSLQSTYRSTFPQFQPVPSTFPLRPQNFISNQPRRFHQNGRPQFESFPGFRPSRPMRPNFTPQPIRRPLHPGQRPGQKQQPNFSRPGQFAALAPRAFPQFANRPIRKINKARRPFFRSANFRAPYFVPPSHNK